MGKSSGDKTEVKIPGYLKDATKSGIAAATGLYGQGPLEYFPGDTYAGLTDPQLQGVNQYIDFANQTFPGLSNQIFGSFGNALNAGNLYNDPSVQAGLGVIESQANRNFMENILPQLRQQATGTGNQFSSKAEQSEAEAARDLQLAISEAQAGFLGNQLGSARQLQGASLATAPSVLGTGLFGGQTLMNAGGVLQGDLQNQINADLARWQYEQQAPVDQTNTYVNQLAALGGMPGGSTTTSGGGSNTLGNIAGGALLGGGLGSTLFPAGSWLGAGAAGAMGPGVLGATVLGGLLGGLA